MAEQCFLLHGNQESEREEVGRTRDCARTHAQQPNFLQLKFLVLLKTSPPADDQALSTEVTLHTENLPCSICLSVFFEDSGALLGRLPSLQA